MSTVLSDAVENGVAFSVPPRAQREEEHPPTTSNQLQQESQTPQGVEALHTVEKNVANRTSPWVLWGLMTLKQEQVV